MYLHVKMQSKCNASKNLEKENNLGICFKKPCFISYATPTARIRSYSTWTRSSPKPVDLADAGFFYTGKHQIYFISKQIYLFINNHCRFILSLSCYISRRYFDLFLLHWHVYYNGWFLSSKLLIVNQMPNKQWFIFFNLRI